MDAISYKTISANSSTVVKDWVIIDAQSAVLGRVASKVAMLLAGKHKPGYTPHVDCGDNVIVINADKVVLTGRKWNQKIYYRHSNHPGGLTALTAKEVKQKDARRLIEYAVKGMLPKNRLGRELFRSLRVYAGTQHPHDAQQPKEVKL